MSDKVIKILTDKVFEMLDEGINPWQYFGVKRFFPQNFTKVLSGTETRYHGINIFLLSIEAGMNDYPYPYWIGFKQCQNLGGKIRKGQHATKIYAPITKKIEEKGKEKSIVIGMRYVNVFNVSQIDWPFDLEEKIDKVIGARDNEVIPSAEQLIEAYARELKGGVVMRSGEGSYVPTSDRVFATPLKHCISSAEHYHVLFHEFAHSTGAESRLNRPGITKKVTSKEDYAEEELIAEGAAVFIANKLGIADETINNNASYMAIWANKLKDSRKKLVDSFSYAEKASNYIFDVVKQKATSVA
jgi:antirestriction protein ArdC